MRACDIGEQSQEERAVDVAMVAVTTSGESSMTRMQDRWEAWQRRIEGESADPVDAANARLAAGALWQADVLGLAPPAAALLRAVISRLEALARPKWIATPASVGSSESNAGSHHDDGSGGRSSAQ